MQHEAIDPIAHRLGDSRFAARGREDAPDLGMIAHDVGGCGRRGKLGQCSWPLGVEPTQQLSDTRRPHADSLDDGYAELASECVLVDDDAALACEIAHVECEQQGHAEPLEREHQAQVLPEIRGVGDADDRVGFRFAVATAE